MARFHNQWDMAEIRGIDGDIISVQWKSEWSRSFVNACDVRRLATLDSDDQLRLQGASGNVDTPMQNLRMAGSEPGTEPEHHLTGIEPQQSQSSKRSRSNSRSRSSTEEQQLPDTNKLKDAAQYLHTFRYEAGIPIDPNSFKHYVPALCIRWTHDCISRRFKQDQRTIFETAEEIIRNGPKYWNYMRITPLEVVYSDGQLWSLSNRRLASFRMAQALSADTLLVECIVFTEHRKFSPTKSQTTRNEGTGVWLNPM